MKRIQDQKIISMKWYIIKIKALKSNMGLSIIQYLFTNGYIYQTA